MNKVLIVDASESDRRLMAGLLVKSGYEPITVETMEATKDEVAKLPPGAVIVADASLRDSSAKELINWQKAEGFTFPVIAIVNNLNGPDLLEVMKGGGAVDVVQRAALNKQLAETVVKYVKPKNVIIRLDDVLIQRPSDEFANIHKQIERIAPYNANVLIIGESGMGKEQIARAIYQQSSRTDKPLRVIEAGGAALVSKHDPASGRSEVYNRIRGYFKDATGGTILIKNIHLLDFDRQSVLLHILSEDHPDVRVLCTAEPELREMISDRSFRSTLYYLLCQVDITVLPLRNTREDIQSIAEYFLAICAKEKGESVKRLDLSAQKALNLHNWPGNIRELKNVIEVAACCVDGNTITAADLPIHHSSPETKDSLRLRNPKTEKQRIVEAIEQANGNITQAAKLLGIGRTTIDYKILKSKAERNEINNSLTTFITKALHFVHETIINLKNVVIEPVTE